MKGKYHVVVQNKRLRYEFDIKRNITVIRGDSATGKTTLYSMVALAARRGDSSGVEVQCEKKCRTLDELDWKLVLPTLHDQIIFLDEENLFLKTRDFAGMAKASDNYFVIITREDLANLPYSVEEIYGIHTAGKYHDMKKVYHEFYHIYGSGEITGEIKPEWVVVEDSNSGFDFFETKCYLPESFEWLILKSGLIDGNAVQDVLEHPQDFIESQEYFSWERFFTDLLIQYTQGTYLNYSKRKLNAVYLHEKNKKAILDTMEKIVFDPHGSRQISM